MTEEGLNIDLVHYKVNNAFMPLCLRTQAVRIKAPLTAQSKEHFPVRKVNKC